MAWIRSLVGGTTEIPQAKGCAPAPPKKGELHHRDGWNIACWEQSKSGKSLDSGIKASVRPELPEESRYVEVGDIELSATGFGVAD